VQEHLIVARALQNLTPMPHFRTTIEQRRARFERDPVILPGQIGQADRPFHALGLGGDRDCQADFAGRPILVRAQLRAVFVDPPERITGQHFAPDQLRYRRGQRAQHQLGRGRGVFVVGSPIGRIVGIAHPSAALGGVHALAQERALLGRQQTFGKAKAISPEPRGGVFFGHRGNA
jgi:hypothetical protein